MKKTSLDDRVELWRVGVREAYQSLKGVIEGVTKWEGQKLARDELER